MSTQNNTKTEVKQKVKPSSVPTTKQRHKSHKSHKKEKKIKAPKKSTQESQVASHKKKDQKKKPLPKKTKRSTAGRQQMFSLIGAGVEILGNLVNGRNERNANEAEQIRARAELKMAEEKAQTERLRMQQNERDKIREINAQEKQEKMKADAMVRIAEEKQETERLKMRQAERETKYKREQEKLKSDALISMEQAKQITERLRIKTKDEQKMRELKEKQYDRAHEIKMQQTKAQNEREQREAEAERERIKQEHEQNLIQIQIDAAEKDKDTKIRQKNESIQRIQSELKESNKLIEDENKELEISKKEFAKVSKELEKNATFIDRFPHYKKEELIKTSAKLQLDAAKRDFERDDKHINAAINKTGQHEADIGKFLGLTHELIGATVETTNQSNILCAHLATFDELIRRQCSDKLKIEHYLSSMGGDGRSLVPILEKENYENMEELICKKEEEYLFEEMLQKIGKGKQKRMDESNEIDEKKEVVAIDLKGPDLARKLLTDWRMSDVFQAMEADCWDDPEDWKHLKTQDLEGFGFKSGQIRRFERKLKEWMEDTTLMDSNGRKLLKWQNKYSSLSIKEIKLLKKICFEPELWKQDELDQTEKTKAGLMVLSPLLADFFGIIYNRILYSQKILSIDNTTLILNEQQQKAIKMATNLPAIEYKNDDDQMHGISNKYNNINRKLAKQCKTLTKAAGINVNVTDSMMDRFSRNIVTGLALDVALSVEQSCMQIIDSQGQIRHSLLLAFDLLKMKPAYLSGEAKILWLAVDKGIVRIMKSAMDMTKFTAQYFAFFPRFKHSFQVFQANKDKSLVVSLGYLHKDCREFSAFKRKFAETVKKLSDDAMDCIKNCVATHVGAKNFEQHQISRENTLKKWLDKKQMYDMKALQLEDEFEKAQIQKIRISSEKARLACKVTMLETSIQSNRENKQKYLDAKTELDKMVI